MPQEEAAPVQFTVTVDGQPWTFVYAPHYRNHESQAIFLINLSNGLVYEHVNGSFVKRPRTEEPTPA